MEETTKPKLTKYSFEEVFEAALQNKILEEDPKEKTIRDYRATYKAFIDENFSSRDIRKMTSSDLKVFLQRIVKEKKPTTKRFLKLKSLLNLVFHFALEHDVITINPVPSSNKSFVKNCAVTCRNPEDKAFQPEDVKLIQEYLWKRVQKLRYYTFAKGDEYLDELCDILDGNDRKKEGVPQGTPKIIAFPAKEKTPEPAWFKGFC